ncbi:YceD family protein [Pararhodospirillum photometricum]|nr:DUF177 domain-containing protein [Pararhodospirillum photometricum]
MTIVPEGGFSRVVEVRTVPPAGRALEITATPEECQAVARSLDLQAVHSLVGRLTLTPWQDDGVRVEGHLRAEVVQTCGLTLVPLDAVVDVDLTRTYSPDAEDPDAALANLDEIDLEALLTEEDPPDPLVDGRIDLGDVLAEELALGLDPFPRAPGAEYSALAFEEEPDPEPQGPNPFAVLERLRKK